MNPPSQQFLFALTVLFKVIAVLALISLLVALAFLVMGIVGWRGPYRGRRFLKAALFASAYPIGVVLVQVLIHYVYLPTMARDRALAGQQRADSVAFVHRGDKAPSFRIQDIDGHEFSTESLRGKVVAVNFFATWCGPCLKELPHIQEIWEAHKEREDFALLVIGREETESAVREFRASRGFSFPMAADTDRAIYGQFAKQLIPRTYLIDRDGTILFTTTGFIEEELAALKKEIATQLRNAK
jgi:peroxiredoxin